MYKSNQSLLEYLSPGKMASRAWIKRNFRDRSRNRVLDIAAHLSTSSIEAPLSRKRVSLKGESGKKQASCGGSKDVSLPLSRGRFFRRSRAKDRAIKRIRAGWRGWREQSVELPRFTRNGEILRRCTTTPDIREPAARSAAICSNEKRPDKRPFLPIPPRHPYFPP